MSDKVRSIRIRDLLNAITALEDGEDQESVVIRCALAVAVETLEEWLYDRKLTPSVVPVESVSGWKPTFRSFAEEIDELRDIVGRERVPPYLILTTDEQEKLGEHGYDVKEEVRAQVADRLAIPLDVAELAVMSYLVKLGSGDAPTQRERTLYREDKNRAVREFAARTGLTESIARQILKDHTPMLAPVFDNDDIPF